MALFNMKKREESQGFGPGMGEMDIPPGMPTETPIDAVRQLQSQGYTNNQIIQQLQQQGFNSTQIFDALNSADPVNIPADRIPQDQMQMGMQQMPPMREQYEPQDMGGGMPDSKERIEEMAEAIIDEKWEELVKSINKIIEWKDKIEDTVGKLQQEMKDLKDNYVQLQNAIIGKIKEYDQNIVNVGTEVKAMEKVFEKVLPTFTENVNELSRTVRAMKGSKK